MADFVRVPEKDWVDILDTVREKTGGTEKLLSGEVAAEIGAIDTVSNQDITVTENGQYQAEGGYTGLGTVTVAVPAEEPVLQELSVTENGEYAPDEGVDGFSKVTVEVETSGVSEQDILKSLADGTWPSGDITITSPLSAYAFYGKAITGVTIAGNGELSDNVQSYAFANSAITFAHFVGPVNNGSGNYYMSGCASLESAVFDPQWPVGTGYNWCFQTCTALAFVDFGYRTKIAMGEFRYCTVLETLVLRSPTLVVSQNTAFDGTNLKLDKGIRCKIYVPEALIDTYKSETNWSVIDALGFVDWVAIEGSEYE